VSDCCLTLTQQIFCNIMASTSQWSTICWWGPLCTRPTCSVGCV